LRAFKAWLDRSGANAGGSLREVIGSGKGTRRWVAAKAPNGCAIARIDIPGTLNTPEFLVNRKEALLSNLLRQSDRVMLTRYGGHPVDERYLYSRNLGGLKTLAGKRIALIGCGTIGGFLAKQLAQSGAGSCGGRLLLLDNDVLQPGNLGRHLLGVRDLAHNKAEGCRDQILRDPALSRSRGRAAGCIASAWFAVAVRPRHRCHGRGSPFDRPQSSRGAAPTFVSADTVRLACGERLDCPVASL
jgi:hypothetical protein